MRYRVLGIFTAAVLTVAMAASTLWVCSNATGVLRNDYENESRAVAGLVGRSIEKRLLQPITVSQTMAKSQSARNILVSANTGADGDVEDDAAAFLRSLRNGFGYDMVFAINDETKAYYTPDGMTRHIDPKHDVEDRWYTEAVRSTRDYTLAVDVEDSADWALSVFVNAPVLDDGDRLLGLCGVGVNMNDLQKLLARHERSYNIEIDLIDEKGLVQVSANRARILKDTVEVENLTDYSDGEVYYEMTPEGNRTITYLESLDWYLIVANRSPYAAAAAGFWIPGLACGLAGLALLCVGYFLIKKIKDARGTGGQ